MHALRRLNYTEKTVLDGDTVIVTRGDAVSDTVWKKICERLGASELPAPMPTDGASQIRLENLMQATERAMSSSARAEPTFRKRR